MESSDISFRSTGLFSEIFGTIEDATDASQIAIDQQGHIEKVVQNVLYQKALPEDLDSKVQYQERNIQILVGVNQLLGGKKKLTQDKEIVDVANKIYKEIKKNIKEKRL